MGSYIAWLLSSDSSKSHKLKITVKKVNGFVWLKFEEKKATVDDRHSFG